MAISLIFRLCSANERGVIINMKKQGENRNPTAVNVKDDAYKVLEIVNSWTNSIDSKISYALAFAGVVLGFVLIQGKPQIFQSISDMSVVTNTVKFQAILVIALYIFSFVSAILMLFALKARIKNENGSMIFFGTIADIDATKYAKDFQKIPEKALVEDILLQVHTNSKICRRKVRIYNWGMVSLCISVTLCFICMAFQFL